MFISKFKKGEFMKNFKQIVLAITLAIVCAGGAYAEEFTPLNFSNPTYSQSSTQKIASATPSTTSATTPAAAQNLTDTIGSKNMQSAITQLDNAQVEVRNELLNYKTKYSEIDAKYNTIKSERKSLAKQVKACEKKIKRLDNAKERIRKNMV